MISKLIKPFETFINGLLKSFRYLDCIIFYLAGLSVWQNVDSLKNMFYEEISDIFADNQNSYINTFYSIVAVIALIYVKTFQEL